MSTKLESVQGALREIAHAETAVVTRPALCIGYSVLDLVEAKHHSFHAGGTATNVAANLAWLGLPTELIARVGDDWPANRFMADVVAEGVGVRHLERDASVETPMLVHRTKSDGSPEYLFACVDCRRKFAKYRPPTLEAAEAVEVPAGTVLFADRASAASIRLMERVRAAGGLVFFEPNGLGRRQLTERALALANIVKISEEKVHALEPALSSIASDAALIRTKSSAGLTFRIGQGAAHHRRATNVSVVDSAGAGDWLTSGLMARLLLRPSLTHANLNEGLKVGQWFAARSCAYFGARGMNTATTLTELLRCTDETPSSRLPEIPPAPARSARQCKTCRRAL